MLPSGRQTTFANRTAWANIFLQRAGLLEKVSRGVYRITDEGRQALVEQPERIDMRFLERYPAYVEWRQRSAAGSGERAAPPVADALATRTPEEQIDASFKSLGAALEDDLLERVREMSPAFFERLIIDLLMAMGYGGGWPVTGQVSGQVGRRRHRRCDQAGQARARYRLCPGQALRRRQYGRALRGAELRRQPRRGGGDQRYLLRHFHLQPGGARLCRSHQQAPRPDRRRGSAAAGYGTMSGCAPARPTRSRKSTKTTSPNEERADSAPRFGGCGNRHS